jgi:hypothetical protein
MHVINDSMVTARRRDTMAMAVLRYTQQPVTTQPTGIKAERTQAAHKAAQKFDIPAVPARQVVQ